MLSSCFDNASTNLYQNDNLPLIIIFPLNADGEGKAQAFSIGINGEVNNSLPKIV